MGEQVGARIHGGVAQLGEHLPCKQGVKSSNLSISTRCKLRSAPQVLWTFGHGVSRLCSQKKTVYESKLSAPFPICLRTLLFASRMYLENRILINLE